MQKRFIIQLLLLRRPLRTTKVYVMNVVAMDACSL